MMNEMKLTFVNVGYGEAVLLECPTKTGRPFVLLVDGGSADPDEYADTASGRIPLPDYLRQNGPDHIDLMVSTHTHEDHICAALQVAKMLPPRELWQTLPPDFYRQTRPLDPKAGTTLSHYKFLQALNDYGTLCALVEDHGGEVRQLLAHQEPLSPCPGLHISVLGPQPAQAEELETRLRSLYQEQDRDAFLEKLTALDARMNNFSLMLLLDWCGTRILLPGDTNRLGYGEIPPKALRADLFKVGHHGQIDGADQALLNAIAPKAVVCCASSDRRYHSAHPDLLQTMQDQGIALYFSDCPPVPNMTVPPHHALTFTIGEGGVMTAEYQPSCPITLDPSP